MAQQATTTHTVIPRQLIVYRRERSDVWQCRFKVDGKWQRASTKCEDLQAAIKCANQLLIEAEIRKRSNLPVVTRKFRDVARYGDYVLSVKRARFAVVGKSGEARISPTLRYVMGIVYKALNASHMLDDGARSGYAHMSKKSDRLFIGQSPSLVRFLA